MRKTFEIPRDIPDVTIENVETNGNGDVVIAVKSTVAGIVCRTCGKQITKMYGYERESRLRPRQLWFAISGFSVIPASPLLRPLA